MPHVITRRRYVRFGFGRNNYCDRADSVAYPSRVIRRGVQSSWSGVDSVAVRIYSLLWEDGRLLESYTGRPSQIIPASWDSPSGGQHR
jgi:hypothetical protein